MPCLHLWSQTATWIFFKWERGSFKAGVRPSLPSPSKGLKAYAIWVCEGKLTLHCNITSRSPPPLAPCILGRQKACTTDTQEGSAPGCCHSLGPAAPSELSCRETAFGAELTEQAWGNLSKWKSSMEIKRGFIHDWMKGGWWGWQVCGLEVWGFRPYRDRDELQFIQFTIGQMSTAEHAQTPMWWMQWREHIWKARCNVSCDVFFNWKFNNFFPK